MEMQNKWVFFEQVDFLCTENNRFNIDTRDFHCGYFYSDDAHPDIETISKYDKFFYTLDELKAQIQRLFAQSGGAGEWRFLTLKNTDTRVSTWLKYIRIWRTERGFIICNSDNKAIPKHILMSDVNTEHLSKH